MKLSISKGAAENRCTYLKIQTAMLISGDKNMGAENGDFFMVMIAGGLFLIYSILFYVCDEEYRNNFNSGTHSYADSPEDNVAEQWSKAKDQFNQIAAKFEKLKPTQTVLR